MNFIETQIPGVLILEPKVFGDARGYFLESYNKKAWHNAGVTADFVQDNESFSRRGVLRGLHYQLPPHNQAKLVRVIRGEVVDVVVDIRKGSPTFGKHVKVLLSGENMRQLWVPHGMAHGFAVLSEEVLFSYKCDRFYAPEFERTILFNDPALNIEWPYPESEMILSPKDINGVPLAAAELPESFE